MPYAISEVVGVLVWKILMDPGIGAIAARSRRRPRQLQLERVAAAGAGAGLADRHLASPAVHLPSPLCGHAGDPQALYEAPRSTARRLAGVLAKITLPLLDPDPPAAVIFRLVFAFRLFSEVWLLTKGGPARLTEVLAVYLYQAGVRYGDFGGPAAGWIMVVGSLLIASIYLLEMQRRMVRQA